MPLVEGCARVRAGAIPCTQHAGDRPRRRRHRAAGGAVCAAGRGRPADGAGAVIERLPPTQQRTLAGLLLLLLLVLAAAAVWLPVGLPARPGSRAGRRRAHRIAELQARIPGREQLLAQEHELQGASTPSARCCRAARRRWRQPSCRAISPDLLQPWAARSPPSQILEPEEAAPFARIGLRLSLSGDMATVRDFLYAVETREPMLIVRRMDLSNVAAASREQPPENPPLGRNLRGLRLRPGRDPHRPPAAGPIVGRTAAPASWSSY